MTDFHTHILPGIDDGSKSVRESLSMLREEAGQGIEEVILTPHYYAGENSPAEFLKRRYSAWKKLEPFLSPELPKLRLGAEVQYFEGICTVEDIRHLRIVGTDLLLLEMPFTRWTNRMVEDVFELNDSLGIQIVLAHIERYLRFQPKEVWQRLRDGGVWMQSNVSFFGGWKKRREAVGMLARGEIHLLGSDCHNMESRRPNWDQLPERAKALFEQSPAHAAFRRLDTDGIHPTVL